MVKLFVLALSAALCCVTANPKRSSDSKSTCERDCDLEDYKCIKRRISLHGHCAVRDDEAQAPETFTLPCPIRFDVPSFNITVVDLSTIIYGLDKCKIVEYCYNKTSGDQVTGIFCKTLSADTHRTVYLHRSLMVDKFSHFNVSSTISDVTLTTIWNRRCGGNLCTSHTFAAFRNLTKLEISADDEETQKFAYSLYKENTLLRVVLQKNVYHHARKFINSVFCDFGCN